MKQTIYFLIIYLISQTQLKSQTIRLNISVLNTQKKLIDGNYMILDSANNIVVGNVFENGTIDAIILSQNNLKLHVGAIGYNSFDTIFSKSIKNIYLTNLEKTLKEIEIKTYKPIFEKTNDGTKINVENTLLSKSANAQELLGKLPTVSINANRVNLFGRGEALIFLNGKEIPFQTFKSLAPSAIKSVEVITNPDAKYDAKGKAIILVTMKKYYSEGCEVQLNNATTYGIIPDNKTYITNSPNISINLRKNKFDFTGYYGNDMGTNWAENNFTTTVNSSNLNTTKKLGYYTEDNHNTSVHYYKLGTSYKIKDNSYLSAQYDGLSHYFNLDVMQNGKFLINDNPLTTINMTNKASTKLVNHSGNINYYTANDSTNTKLFIGAQYNNFKNLLYDQITEKITDTNFTSVNNRINKGVNNIELVAFQVDYSFPLKTFFVEVGSKYSYNTNKGKLNFYSKSSLENEFNENKFLANETQYTEQIPAAYLTLKRTYKKLSGSLGARYEHTLANSVSKRYNITLLDINYGRLFPSAKLNYKINDNLTWNNTYTNKITRPLYQDLDPFLWYLDSLTAIRGNSKLVPEIVHQIETKFNYTYFSIKYAYTRTNRAIASVMTEGAAGKNSVVFTKDNIENRYFHSIGLEVPFEKNNYNCYNSIIYNIIKFQDSRSQYVSEGFNPQLYFYSYHSLAIPKFATLEFTAEYYGASFDGVTKKQPYYYFTVAISRNFLKNEALNVNLTWNDLLRTARWKGHFNVNTYGNKYNQQFMTSYVRLNLSYNLKSKTKFNYKNKNVNSDEFNRIKK